MEWNKRKKKKLNRANRALKAEQPMNKKKMMVGKKRSEVKNADKNNTSKYS